MPGSALLALCAYHSSVLSYHVVYSPATCEMKERFHILTDQLYSYYPGEAILLLLLFKLAILSNNGLQVVSYVYCENNFVFTNTLCYMIHKDTHPEGRVKISPLNAMLSQGWDLS